jgi:hypothetical protein
MRVQGLGINEFKQSYWSKALNWSQSPLDKGPRANSDAKPKWHLFWRENQLVGTKKEEC